MPTDPFQTLTRLGLSESEARMYLAMLSCGAQPVQALARKAHVARTAAYDILGSLEKRGLVTKKAQGAKRLYLAEDPERVEAYFAQRLQMFSTELATFQRIAPELRVLQGREETRPRVRFLSGYEGIETLFSDIARVAPDELLEYANATDIQRDLDMERIRNARKLIDFEHTRVKLLHTGEYAHPSLAHVTYRTSPHALPFSGDFWIYANRVVLLTTHPKIDAVVIDHHEFAKTLRSLFFLAWDCATPSRAAAPRKAPAKKKKNI